MKLLLLLSTKLVDLVGEERDVIDKVYLIADRTQAKINGITDNLTTSMIIVDEVNKAHF